MSANERDDCFLEEVTEEQLITSGATKYGSYQPFAFCSYCEEKDCGQCRLQAEKISDKIFEENFKDGKIDKKHLIDVLRSVPDFIKKSTGSDPEDKFTVCVIIQLMEKIDEETDFDVEDPMVESAVGIYGEFRK